jgi:CubicO group peptidase (beta-lactamase class C family)
MKKRLLLTAVVFTLLLTSCGQPAALPTPNLDERIQSVENGLLPAEGWGIVAGNFPDITETMSLTDRMDYYHVPGVSIAVINDYEIEWAKGYGVLEAGGDEPVTPDTLFQAASNGKLLTAVAVMHYVEQGLLDLDEDVNNNLVSWKVPENEFTVQEKVTLRRLLSHTAGVTVPGFFGYPQGEDLPTNLQILDGEPPANNDAIRVDTVPGTEWRYSSGGYQIVQQLLEDVVGKPFPEIMQETVLEPSGMTSGIYAVPLPEDLRDRAATAHNRLGRPAQVKWHELACMGAGGGLWTTTSDLARFAIEIMHTYAGESNQVISQDALNMMLIAESELDENIHQGVGFVFWGEGRDFTLPSTGGNPPGFLSILIAFPERGQGAAIMTNGANGLDLGWEILNSLAVEYEWPSLEAISE